MNADIIGYNGDNGSTPSELRESVDELGRLNPCAHIIVILGNHEAHGRVWEEYIEEYRAALADLPGVTLLENESVEIGGYTFVGATLWTDLNPIAAIAVQKILEDYRPTGIRSRNTGGDLVAVTPDQVSERNRESLRYIESVLRTCEDPSRVVVMTHHAPSKQSWTERDTPLSDRLSEAYCNDLDGFIEGYQPLLWVHGHVHQSQDYEIGETKVVCNPQGYAKVRNGVAEYGNPNFDPTGAVVDLELLRDIRLAKNREPEVEAEVESIDYEREIEERPRTVERSR